MKRYYILACFLISNIIFGMEPPALTSTADKSQKQQQLLDLIEAASPTEQSK